MRCLIINTKVLFSNFIVGNINVIVFEILQQKHQYKLNLCTESDLTYLLHFCSAIFKFGFDLY